LKPLLKILWRLYKPYFKQLEYLEQTKSKGFEKLEKVFIDSNGKQYYKYIDPFDIPMQRYEQVQILLMELDARVSKDEMNQFLEAMGLALNESDKNLRKTIGFLIGEMERRKELLFHPDIMMKLLACMVIREDQDSTLWDEEIEKEKIIQFKQDSKQGEGLHDFFMQAGLSLYIPSLPKLKDGWGKYLEKNQLIIKKLNETMTDIITELKSTKGSAKTEKPLSA